jgi:hypothetical protein
VQERGLAALSPLSFLLALSLASGHGLIMQTLEGLSRVHKHKGHRHV